jgi:hypothetical protein
LNDFSFSSFISRIVMAISAACLFKACLMSKLCEITRSTSSFSAVRFALFW